MTLTSSWMRRQTWTRMNSTTVTMTWTSLKTGVKTSWHTRPMGDALHDSAETLVPRVFPAGRDYQSLRMTLQAENPAKARYASPHEAPRHSHQHRRLRGLLLARPRGPRARPAPLGGARRGGRRHGVRVPEHHVADPREPGDRGQPARARHRRQPH